LGINYLLTSRFEQVLIYLMMTIHMLACVWWLYKVQWMSLEEVNQFLDEVTWGSYVRSELESPNGKMEAYVISIYITTMTLTTVGYGDIASANTPEVSIVYVGDDDIMQSMFLARNNLLWCSACRLCALLYNWGVLLGKPARRGGRDPRMHVCAADQEDRAHSGDA
jgi:hypothetical protein